MKRISTWIDERTGLGDLVRGALFEPIPGGARWRYVWGSTLVFAFVTQAVTGLFLWMAYSPSAQTAWESVYYIQYEMQGGWLVRGIHHFMAQAMIVLLALHLIQVVIDGAYRAPREFNFWIGLLLMQVVLALSLTGYLLPWDQKGYWATQVATKLCGVIPVVGIPLQRLIVGGATYGHHTLTRFFALHAGLLPALLVGLVVVHLYLFRRHGICAVRRPGRPDGMFWPEQVLRDAVASLAVLVVVLLLVAWPALWGSAPADAAGWGHLGADLGAPADPARGYSAARPEWYFLFLFQFLKFFHGEQQELVGAVGVPAAVLVLLALMPLLGNWRLGHGFNVALLLALVGGAVALTGMALVEDRRDEDFARAVAEADAHAHRVKELIRVQGGIPIEGAMHLLRRDPLTQGPLLFARHCASCHPHVDLAGPGAALPPNTTAPNLFGFGSRAWLAGLLDPARVDSPEYFGNTAHREGEMAAWIQENLAEPDDEQSRQLHAVIAALSAEAELPAQRALDAADEQVIAEGRRLIAEEIGCSDCHKFHDAGELGTAPELTGWASRAWLVDFVSDPAHERFYGENNDRMPRFAPPPGSPSDILSPQELGLIVDWLRGEGAAETGEPPAPSAAAPASAADASGEANS